MDLHSIALCLAWGLWAVADPFMGPEARATPGTLPPFSSFPSPLSGVIRSEGHPTGPHPGFLSTRSHLVQHVSGKKVASDPSHWPKATAASWEGLWNPWEPSGLGLPGLNLAQQDCSQFLG